MFAVHGVSLGCCTCRDPDCKHPGKHPLTAHGFLDAVTDIGQITAWWDQWPAANIGIATGTRSGLLVVDIDPRHGGDDSLRDLELQHGRLPETPTVITGAGEHRYLRHPGGYVPSKPIAPGIDVKADGGYVVSPPSIHASGRRYAWDAALGLGDLPLAPAPAWVVNLTREVRSRPEPERAAGMIPSGERNSELASLAGTMRRRGMTEGEISAALMAINEARCVPPLSDREVLSIAANVARYSPADPTTVIDRRAWARARRFG